MLVASLHILANPYTLNKGIRVPYAISANPYIGTQLQSPSFSIMILVITSPKQNHFITIYFRIIIVMMTKDDNDDQIPPSSTTSSPMNVIVIISDTMMMRRDHDYHQNDGDEMRSR